MSATLDAFAGIDVTMPDGTTRTCRVLTVGESLRLLGVLDRARSGDGAAVVQFIEEFTEAVGLGEEHITPGEVFGLAESFFWSSRLEPKSPQARAIQNGKPTPQETGSSSAGTT